MPANHSQTYKLNDVSTANRMKLVLMLYDGAIRFLREARNRIELNDAPGRSAYLSKALRIVGQLHGSLNQTEGGEIAVQLDRLYSFINVQISRANVTGKAVHVENSWGISTANFLAGVNQ
ncbi:MAG: flagellar export chaperone FliS [Nitrospinae bacterium]|nr:flagellar export chaperone FliS [Nitrospinota bacterium]